MGGQHPVPIDKMEVRQIIRQGVRQGVTLSALAHVLMLALIVLYSEVHPFSAVTAEPIAVDLVRSDEVEKTGAAGAHAHAAGGFLAIDEA